MDKEKQWYEAGKKAARKGFDRISPYYENPKADKFFFLGHDGEKFPEELEKPQTFKD